jgi:hypothetical protein
MLHYVTIVMPLNFLSIFGTIQHNKRRLSGGIIISLMEMMLYSTVMSTAIYFCKNFSLSTATSKFFSSSYRNRRAGMALLNPKLADHLITGQDSTGIESYLLHNADT